MITFMSLPRVKANGLLAAAICAAAAFSLPVQADATAKPAAPPFKVSSGFSHAFQKYSGLNWLTNATLSGTTSLVLSAKTHGFVHARIRTYGFTDLFDGEFRSVDITAHGGKFRGVPFGNVHLATDNPFKLHYFQRRGHNNWLLTPLMVSVDGDIDQAELSRAMNSDTVTDNLRFLKFDLPGLGEQRLQVLKPKVELVNGHVKVNSFLITAGAPKETGVRLEVTAKPFLEKERYIKLDDMSVVSPDIDHAETLGPFTEQLFNPLIDFGRFDRFTHAFRMTNFAVDSDRVKYAGRLLLVPKQTAKPTFSAPPPF